MGGASPCKALLFKYIYDGKYYIRVWKVFHKWYFIGVAIVTYVQRLRVIVNSKKITRLGFVFGKISRALFLSVWFLSRLFSSVLFAAVAANVLFSKINVCCCTTQEPTFKQSTLVVLTSTRGNYASVKSQKEDSVKELKVFACVAPTSVL